MKTYIAIIVTMILEAINAYQALELVAEFVNNNWWMGDTFNQILTWHALTAIIVIPVFMIAMVKVWNFVIDDVMRQLEEEDEA